MKLSKKTTSMWSKKRIGIDGTPLWLPLITHLTDTKNVISWLYENWLSDGQRQILKRSTPYGTYSHSEQDIEKLISFVGFFHDIGKATPAFQKKTVSSRDEYIDKNIMERLMESGFSEINKKELSNSRDSPHGTAGEALLEYWEVPVSVGAIIGGHHGLPLSETPSGQISRYTDNYFQSETHPEIAASWKQTQREILDYGLELVGYSSVKEIPDVSQPQAVILEGLLIMADWLASSERLTNASEKELFPLVSLDTSYDEIDTDSRFDRAIGNWNLSDKWIPQKISSQDNPYKSRWGFEARPVQTAVTHAIAKTDDPGIIIIEAPTGVGKTEIALIAAEQLATIRGEDGVFIGLPTQATANAMFDRVDDWLEKVAKSQDERLSIKLMHGKARFNRHYQKIPDATNVEVPNTKAPSVTVNGWFSGKKSILTKFSVGTIDNLLLMGLKQKHLFLKHLGLSGKIVIIDEAHAIDIFMSQYLHVVISWLGAYHVPIVVLSATLPNENRNSLIEAYLKGKYGSSHPKGFKAPDRWQSTEAYPLLSILDGKELRQVTKFEGHSDQKPYTLQIQKINPTDEKLIQMVLTQISEGGIAGIIVNTVKRAQALARLIPKGADMMIVHAAFLSPAREAQEEKLQRTTGKNAHRPKKMIVIGTQVLEQSLDIDFDILYTDIAPMDLIIQRAGRLHRHHIKRPKALQTPQVFIMGINGPGDYGKANELIYQRYLLMKTDYFLGDKINIPQDVSKLVQAVYSKTNDNEISGMIGINESLTGFKTYLKTEAAKAEAYQVTPPDYFGDLHGWLNQAQNDVDKNEQLAKAAVRDIKQTVEVIMIQHTNKGDFLIPVNPDEQPQSIQTVSSKTIAKQLIRIPSSITPKVNRVIDVLAVQTHRYYPDWRNDVWLKGALVLRLDNNLSASLEGWRLHYSTKFGLSYSKEGDYEN